MRKKKQPTADMLRQQLALAADEIIRLRTALAQWERQAMKKHLPPPLALNAPRPWWRRLLAWVGG